MKFEIINNEQPITETVKAEIVISDRGNLILKLNGCIVVRVGNDGIIATSYRAVHNGHVDEDEGE